MKEIIKQLKEERYKILCVVVDLESKIEKIDKIVSDLEGFNKSGKKKVVSKSEQIKGKSVRKPRTNKVKKVIHSDPKLKVIQPERTERGQIKAPRKKLFPDEINAFIKRNWEKHTDSELRLMIGEEFDKYFSRDQIKGHRKTLGAFSNTIGRRKGMKTIIRPESDEKQLKEDDDPEDDDSINDMELE